MATINRWDVSRFNDCIFINRYTQDNYEIQATVAVEEMETLASAESALNFDLVSEALDS